MVKEFTGHRSDAIDQYQITSHEQRKQLSEIVQGSDGSEVVEKDTKVDQTKEKTEQKSVDKAKCHCECNGLNETNVVQVVSELLKKNS